MIKKVVGYQLSVIGLVFILHANVFAAVSKKTDVPQNVIFMVIDGCGFNHIAATDYYEYGKKGGVVYGKFPVKLAVSTYSAGGSYDPEKAQKDFDYVEAGGTDSAAAATAFATGVKTSDGSLGVDANGKPVENVIEKCEKLGMSTGVVTTVPFSDATPAGFVVHQKSRNSYEQIIDEMINKSELEVIFGCGHFIYDNNGQKVEAPDDIRKKMWDLYIAKSTDKWALIQSRAEFVNLANGQTPKRVLGIVESTATLQSGRRGGSKMPFDVPFDQNMPTLAEMSNAALNVLDDDPDGFFVMIEGGSVDWTSHGNDSARMIEEMIDFENAVKAVVKWVETKSSWKKTLVIITADHETGRLSGPDKSRFVINAGKGKIPLVGWYGHNHTNSLVAFFAKGAGAKSFIKRAKNNDPVYGRYMDNTDIPKTIFKFLEARKLQIK